MRCVVQSTAELLATPSQDTNDQQGMHAWLIGLRHTDGTLLISRILSSSQFNSKHPGPTSHLGECSACL